MNFCPRYQTIAKRDHEKAGHGLIPDVFPRWQFRLATYQQQSKEQSACGQLADDGKKKWWKVLYTYPHSKVGSAPYQTHSSKSQIGSKGGKISLHNRIIQIRKTFYKYVVITVSVLLISSISVLLLANLESPKNHYIPVQYRFKGRFFVMRSSTGASFLGDCACYFINCKIR